MSKSLKEIFGEKEIYRALKALGGAADFYELHFTGGTHIIYEDGNYRKSDVEFCLEEAIKKKNLLCYLICILLNEFDTKKEIEKAVEESVKFDLF